MITNSKDYLLNFGELVEQAIDYRNTIDVSNICKYGINVLDSYVGGILPSELVVIGAESGVGKSEVAYNIAFENAKRDKKVLLIALEGDIQEPALRFLQKEINKKTFVKTSEYRFNTKNVIQEEKQVYNDLDAKLKKNLFIYNKKEIPTMQFLKELIHTTSEMMDMIIIDHLHYIHMDSDTETREIGKIMRELKTITDIIKKPIVLISHLRKRNVKNIDEDPTMNDLYGSSNIAKEATTIILLRKFDKEKWFDMPYQYREDQHYTGNKIIIEKSRIGIPKSAFQLLYDRNRKIYVDEFCSLIEEESGLKKDEKIDLFIK